MRMFLTASQEMTEFLLSLAAAVLAGILYDFFMCVKPKKISKPAADFFDLFSLFSITVFFCIFWQKFLSGRFRVHTVFGFTISLILYFLTIHKPIFTAYCIIRKKISSFLGRIFKFLLTVKAFLGKITLYISMLCKKIYVVDCKGKNYEKKRYKI